MKKIIFIVFFFFSAEMVAEDKTVGEGKNDRRVKVSYTLSDLTQPKAPRFRQQTPDAKNVIYMKDYALFHRDGTYFVNNEASKDVDVRLNFGTTVNPAIITIKAQSIVQFMPSDSQLDSNLYYPKDDDQSKNSKSTFSNRKFQVDLLDIQIKDVATGATLTTPDTLTLSQSTRNSIVINISDPAAGSTTLRVTAFKTADTKNILAQN